jgi:hypothetical protein
VITVHRTADFDRWLAGLRDRIAARKITTRIDAIKAGHLGLARGRIDDLKVTAVAVETIERAKGLAPDPTLDLAARMERAVHALGLRLAAVPAEPRAA